MYRGEESFLRLLQSARKCNIRFGKYTDDSCPELLTSGTPDVSYYTSMGGRFVHFPGSGSGAAALPSQWHRVDGIYFRIVFIHLGHRGLGIAVTPM